jgi:hypothetical protein
VSVRIIVRESLGNGFVTQIDLWEPAHDGNPAVWHDAFWTGSDPAAAGKVTDFLLTFTQTTYPVGAVRLTISTNHNSNTWEEIDAVRLLTGGSPGSTSTGTNARNLAPVAGEDWATTEEGNEVVVSVLGNDSDPDGDPLSVTAKTDGAHGTVTIAGDGQSVTYDPGAYVGDDTFTYTVSDGEGGSATQTVHVTVFALGQWASSLVSASSQHSGRGYSGSGLQALGVPDTLSRDTNLHAVSGHELLRTEPFTPDRPEQLWPLAYPSWTPPSFPLASRGTFPGPSSLRPPCFLRQTRYFPLAG